MEHFIVSARKYRPTTFADVVGQQAITNTLVNAIENNHLAQALLFTGPRGVGKTTCARILAKKINQDGTDVAEDEDFAFNIFELDAASNNSVDDIRNLIDQVRIPPQVGHYKVYIIDEVHMLSQAAFNAFLKTLEEPPKHAIFILATTEKHKIIPTILSRCQIFDFKRITVTDAKQYLANIAEKEGVNAEDDALHIIAQKADGAMRDALSIYDRVVSFSGNNLTRQAVTENLNVLDYDTYFEMTDHILNNNIPEALVQFNTILSKGFDGHHFIAGMASHFRDLLVCKNQETIQLLEVGDQTKQRYVKQSQEASKAFLIEGIELANSCDLKYKTSRNQRLLVELCLMQLASITFDGEKKNRNSFIIPASHFANRETPPKQTLGNSKVKIAEEQKTIIQQEEHPIASQASEVSERLQPTTKDTSTNTLVKEDVTTGNKVNSAPNIDLGVARKKTSALSMKGLKRKKEILEKKQEADAIGKDMPKEDFTEEQLHDVWKAYIDKIKTKGGKIMASILATDIPRVEGTNLYIQLPNVTMKTEVERHSYHLMTFLKKELQNYDIQLFIDVNEEAAKKYAFTPMEKYNKLREKNPLIDELRQTFDLDI
ncbi:DNA polymerase III subunit gamma/tau [Croceibacter atlanticus]|jgi:DNA polymerase-3 subunit gamma/tau|uniref:DNA polymerase III subunit gamma/tau n=1 Tax=Croceibacter atlanticus (strain ATCC BAA-628 / JCM 21780 / CIP 108009 / IAM 15332 / KCTC 12090 / HTCC2559) TaxID=216432 RepID=A3UAA1_CROAH|nr:DNA polymerase III subunit gamma/tau [Croceibacter atlanticus]EAP86737.1 DNA polymerase III subunit gamma/tau [Croceibacter atlanticus HTCC2559]